MKQMNSSQRRHSEFAETVRLVCMGAALFGMQASFFLIGAFLIGVSSPQESHAQDSEELIFQSPSETILEESLPLATPTPKMIPQITEDELKAFHVSNPSGLSGRILFSAKVGDYWRIFLLDLDGRKVYPVIDGPGNNRYPSFSPDGLSIVFSSDRYTRSDIFTAPWDGKGEQKRVTFSKTKQDQPDYSPDGSEIVFVTELSPGNSEIYIASLETNSSRAITSLGERNLAPKFSKNGKEILYTTNRFWPGWDVCIWYLNQQTERCILTGRASYSRARWSPDGNQLAYSVGEAGEVDIATLNRPTKQKSVITSLPNREYDPEWSPDGKQVAFVADNDQKGNFNLFAIGLSQPRPQVLVEARYPIRQISWSKVTVQEIVDARNKIELEKQKTNVYLEPDDDEFGDMEYKGAL